MTRLGRTTTGRAGVSRRQVAPADLVNELEDLPLQAQRGLLGVLESGQFLRVGGSVPVTLKARLDALEGQKAAKPAG